MFNIPKDFQYPFELTAAEQQQLELLQACRVQEKMPELSIEVERVIKQFIFSKELEAWRQRTAETAEKKAVKTTALLHDLAISLIQQAKPELIAKFILLDPSLMEAADDERLKEYWARFAKSYLFVVKSDGNLVFCKQKDAEVLFKGVPRKRTYTLEFRDDLSYATQAIASFCFLQSMLQQQDKLKREAWRILAIKLGSLDATYHQISDLLRKIAPPPRGEGSVSIQTPGGIKIINATLQFLCDISAIHGSAGLFLLAHFTHMLGYYFMTFGETQELSKKFLECCQTAFLLANNIFNEPFCQRSIANLTCGDVGDFHPRYFPKDNLQEMAETIVRKIDEETLDEITKKAPALAKSFLAFFPASKPASNREWFEVTFPTPRLPDMH